jgi:hypothetical protein
MSQTTVLKNLIGSQPHLEMKRRALPDVDESDWVARFEEFDAAHPEVYGMFRFFALELLAAGRTRGGARSIIERVRWHTAINSSDGEFKINNCFIPFYARKLAKEDGRFESFFSFRTSRADDSDDEAVQRASGVTP